MLAQNFKTPAELQITDAEFEALVKVLGMLERGELEHNQPNVPGDLKYFNMAWVQCGTAGCIAGWACHLSQGQVFSGCIDGQDWFHEQQPSLRELLMPARARDGGYLALITTDQAAIALRNYLTHGEPRWAEALAD